MEEIKNFVKINTADFSSGDGSGDGFGSGDGSGYGDGFGSGDGSGYGSGFGSGDGDGDGSGNGDGDGSGSGYGYGYGNGDGDGSGSGYGLESINNKKIYLIDSIQTIIESVKGNVARGYIVNTDLTLSPCYIAKKGNFFAHGETLKQAVKDVDYKFAQSKSVDEKIAMFVNNFPKLDTVVKASNLVDWHGLLTGSCKMGRESFASDHAIDLERDSFTVQQFIDLTKKSYGGDIIKVLEDKLKRN